jgi:hypothetical protein
VIDDSPLEKNEEVVATPVVPYFDPAAGALVVGGARYYAHLPHRQPDSELAAYRGALDGQSRDVLAKARTNRERARAALADSSIPRSVVRHAAEVSGATMARSDLPRNGNLLDLIKSATADDVSMMHAAVVRRGLDAKGLIGELQSGGSSPAAARSFAAIVGHDVLPFDPVTLHTSLFPTAPPDMMASLSEDIPLRSLEAFCRENVGTPGGTADYVLERWASEPNYRIASGRPPVEDRTAFWTATTPASGGEVVPGTLVSQHIQLRDTFGEVPALLAWFASMYPLVVGGAN